ncbi:hypothetical protein [Thermoflexibacter ruber]|jgi:hypothetical protein|uniref:Uncharacterized protein n=1 Tax=Thermoflexibacter ruber TaxID=1003 RepID=A0A1I2G4R3_9BACT|nr:hypothetical protein [Thermoflexibacter ruber]SFF12158.1 hypothetical protein SAMN04488541_101684 [Thermoflexibacter ruber]
MKQNPFKQIGQKQEKLPENFKKDVMESIEMSKVLLGIADLFTVKMGETFTGIFRTEQDKYNKK